MNESSLDFVAKFADLQALTQEDPMADLTNSKKTISNGWLCFMLFYTFLSSFYPLDKRHVLYPASESASLFIYFLSEVILVLMHDDMNILDQTMDP